MEKDRTEDRYKGKILEDLQPFQMRKALAPFLEELNSATSQYFPSMLKKYELEKIETPPISAYGGNVFDTGFLGYVKVVKSASDVTFSKPRYIVMIDQGDLFHAQMSGRPYSLVETVGGLLGTVIRWNVHPPPENYVPSITEQFIEKIHERSDIGPEEARKNARISYEFRNVGHLFEWIGKHTFRDVFDPSWKLEHEVYDTDVKPFLEKEKNKILQKIDKGIETIEEVRKKTDSSITSHEQYKQTVKGAVNSILGEWGRSANESDNPFERKAWNILYINFPCWDYSITDVLEDVSASNVKLLVENKWGFKSDTTPLQSYAKSWPEFFQDLSEGKTEATPEVVRERLVKMVKEAISLGMNGVKKQMAEYNVGTYFDYIKASRSESDMYEVFRAAEKHESFLLQNLPTVIKMTDENIKTKYFPQL